MNTATIHSTEQVTLKDPREAFPKPPFPDQGQAVPGSEAQMQPQPDYGEASYKGSGRLAGRKALITGADSGIGRAVALAFAREGADVVIAYLNEDKDAQETARIVTESGRKAVLAPGDIQDEAHCQALVARAVSELGGLDILVNNAAYQKTFESIHEITTEELEKTFRTNIFAMFYLSKAALKVMPAGGAIINSCSIEAFQPDAMLMPYAATKGAIVNFTKSLAEEALKQGVRVNSVAPGPVWTPLIPSTMPPEEVKTFGKQAPMARPAQPVELSPAYVFLASQEASFISAQTIGVTGGKPLM